jgi:lysozyme family protein
MTGGINSGQTLYILPSFFSFKTLLYAGKSRAVKELQQVAGVPDDGIISLELLQL